MNVLCNVNIHAHVEILELGVHAQSAYAGADAQRGSERTGSHRNAIADFKAGLNSIRSANARILKNLGIGITEQQLRMNRIEGYRVVGRVQMLKAVEVQAAAGGGCASTSTGSSAGAV